MGTLALGTGAALLLLAALGMVLGTFGRTRGLGEWVWENWPVQLAQQIVLFVLLWPRLVRLHGDEGPVVSLSAAVLFAGLHLPNLLLAALVLPVAFGWCEWYRRFRNLPAVWLSHFVLAGTLLFCLNGPALAMLRVGIGYLHRR